MVLSIGKLKVVLLTLPMVLMIFIVAFPVGNAIGKLISPAVKVVRISVCSFLARYKTTTDLHRQILVLAIICSAVSPFILFVGRKPPSPPSMPLFINFISGLIVV